MSSGEDFRRHAKELVDFVTDYSEGLRDEPVLPGVQPGYLVDALPVAAPEKAESFEDVMKDVVKHVMPGVTQWHSPNFYAYYPGGHSYTSMLGEIKSPSDCFITFHQNKNRLIRR